ncbi:MAG: bifunctional riboflavin kinase/FMN adenylyltransferase [Clostridiales bacterium]|nr:bifunctional riboflavin kinase/FMN adenylyltransferase [Clostridiales bacterium]
MKYIHDTINFNSKDSGFVLTGATRLGAAVTLGKFDGLHRGHQKLIQEVLCLQRKGCYGIAFTIAPEDRTTLITAEEKRQMLEAYGIDCMIRCPYVPEILSMEPEAFISEVLCRQLNAKHIVVGTDFRFGCQRRGDVELLKAMQEKYSYTLHVIQKECYNGREISSTWIREALSGADMELVRSLMGGWFPVEGTVLHGHHLGHQIGMPTINIKPDPYKLLPPPGVYFSDVIISDPEKLHSAGNMMDCNDISDKHLNVDDCRMIHGITNIGYKPTVDGTFLGVETYLYGIEEDLYGRDVKVLLRCFRRPEQKFASVDELKAQMKRDIESGKEYFGAK